MLKKFSSIVAAALLALTVSGCSGAGPEETVKGFMDAWKSLDYQKAAGYFLVSGTEEDTDSTAESGLSESLDFGDLENLENIEDVPEWAVDFLKENAAKLDYEIVSAKTEGDRSDVVLQVTYPDASPLIGDIVSAYFVQVFEQAFSEDELSEEEIQQLLEDIAKDQLENAELELREDTVTAELIRIDDKWYLEEPQDDFRNALTMGLTSAVNQFAEQWENIP